MRGLWKTELLILAGVVALIAFAPSDEYDRQQRRAEFLERFHNGCMPRKGDIVTAEWIDGELKCKRITPSPRYGKTFPHAEVRVAIVTEEEQ